MIDDDKCSEEIYKYGESCDLRTDLTKQQANEFCEKLTNDSEEYAYDWHYTAGRVHIKRLKKSLLGYQDEVRPTEAVERPLTLVEKLERERDHHNHFLETCHNDRDKAYHSFGKKCYQKAIDIVKQHSQETCSWRNNKGTGLWECHYGGDYTSDCGLEWNMSNKDSPSENEMHFCPKCGRKLVEAKPLSDEEQEKIYEQEMDKIKFCGCGCILPDGLTRCSDCEAQYD